MLLSLLTFLSCIAFVHVSYECKNWYLLPLCSKTCSLPHLIVLHLWASHTTAYPHSCCAHVNSPCCGLSHLAVVHMWISKITTIGGLSHTAAAQSGLQMLLVYKCLAYLILVLYTCGASMIEKKFTQHIPRHMPPTARQANNLPNDSSVALCHPKLA